MIMTLTITHLVYLVCHEGVAGPPLGPGEAHAARLQPVLQALEGGGVGHVVHQHHRVSPCKVEWSTYFHNPLNIHTQAMMDHVEQCHGEYNT